MSQNSRIDIGKRGEDFSCQYLIEKGYKILNRNFRKKFGEIDVIARSDNGTLVFCEVKTMVEKLHFPIRFTPEDNLTCRKVNKMKRAAQFYTAKNPDLVDEEKGWRIDVIAITLGDDSKTIKRIHHYENI